MIIKASSKEYSLSIHQDFSFIIPLLQSENTLFVIDNMVYQLYFDELFKDVNKDSLYLIEAKETKKTIESSLEICEIMTRIPAKRNAHLISFGGGIIQDITGFAANILYRGINWTFIPTTLLAACDSCIGGKTSLNYKNYKNLLGTFFPPDNIHICPQFFHTLSERDFESGLGEVVKFNLMFGQEGLARMEQDLHLLLERNEKKLNEYVEKSLLFKKRFIEADEFDHGIRIHLNFAHTFGHAFESISDYMIPHGTAVAMGMIVANRISLFRGLLDTKTVQRMEEILFQIIHVDLSSVHMDIDKLVTAIRKDKKQTGTNLTAILMYDDMKMRMVHDLTKRETETAILYIYNKLQRSSGQTGF